LVCILFFFNGFGSNELGNPFIRNYTPDDYRGHTQNWSIVQDQRGVIYVGNEEGILELAGKIWKPLLVLPNKSRVRSLAIDAKGIVYVGGMGDFGFLAINAKGKRIFQSLKDKLKKEDLEFSDVWNIAVSSAGVYFVTMQKIFHWNYRQINVISEKLHPLAISAYDQIYFTKADGGLFRLDENQLTVLPHADTSQMKFRINSALPYGDQELLVLYENGDFIIYNLQGLSDYKADNTISVAQRIRPFPTEIGPYIRQNFSSHCSVRIGDHLFAYGTFNGGIVIMDEKGKLIQIINRNRGLPDNQIWQLFVDNQQNLWATQNYGLSCIEAKSPFTHFNQLNNLKGMVISCIRYQQQFYAGTFEGIFYLKKYQMNPQDDQQIFLPIKNSNSTCFNFHQFRGLLLATGNNQIYQIIDDEAHVLTTLRWPLCFGQSSRFLDYIFVGQGNGLSAIKLTEPDHGNIKRNHPWQAELIHTGSFSQIKYPIHALADDPQGNLWLSTELDGILRLEFTKDSIDQFIIHHYTTRHGLPDMGKNWVHRIHDRIVVLNETGFYQAVDAIDKQSGQQETRFSSDTIYGKYFSNGADPAMGLFEDQQNKIWSISFQGMRVLTPKPNGSFFMEHFPFKPITGQINRFRVEDNGIVWICGVNNRYLYRFDSTIKKNYSIAYPALIQQVRTIRQNTMLFEGTYYDPNSGSNDSYQRCSLDQPPQLVAKLPYADNSLFFEYSALFYEQPENIQYHYIMKGFDQTWSDWNTETKKEYSNLPEGNYSFWVQAKNIYLCESSPAIFQFAIFPPWHRTWWAYSLFLLIFIGIIAAAVNLNSRRLQASKKHLEKIVSERTAEVVEQKQEIETYAADLFSANQQLTDTKNALWGEMELAKKIQTVLLPQQPKIPGYEIAVFMQTADEVGGDYYDVICIDNNDRRGGACLHPDSERAEEKDGEPCRGGSCARPQDSGQFPKTNPEKPSNLLPGQPQGFAPTDSLKTIHHPPSTDLEPSYWLSIGDVSGHGVSAGLVMMMVQTAIHAVLKNHAHETPDKILKTVNSVIYENIRKMDEDKYMTITLMAIQPSGRIHYSGLHQDIMIYCSTTGQVELAETKGMWLGMMDKLGDTLPVDEIRLQNNDVLLLYTDGIVEAMDGGKKMYSDKKLAKVFQQFAHLSPQAVKQGIIDSLAGYTCNDDITFMVIKKDL
jgi:serine phosphatase RsbU (regulator of sigma subunit)/ligand-binding sensor domain-containing protein